MISYGVLSPHAPVLIREIGKEKVQAVQATEQALQKMARDLLASQPDTILFLTPHGNVFMDCITYLSGGHLEGNLAGFGQPDMRTSQVNDVRLVETIAELAAVHNLEFIGVDASLAARHELDINLDHGIMVPLYFLEQAGMHNLPIAAISIGMLDNYELYGFGRLIQEASNRLNKRVAVVASGDMSHRLKEEGPYSFHPDGSRFDLRIKQALSTGDVQAILGIPADLRSNAGECGYPSLVILLGTLDGYHVETNLLSYEGPFGVGYLTAGLKTGEKAPSLLQKMRIQQAEKIARRREGESPLVRWARFKLESKVRKAPAPLLEKEMEYLLDQRSAAFVSIKKHGQLRGCIGTFQPCYSNLAEEIAHNALAAGLQDPRFSPVEEWELVDLEYSVDVLAPPEPCTKDDLDPSKYGVIVKSGPRRGLLLPDLEGIDTVEKQLAIACQKGNISTRESYEIERFEVKRYT